MRSGRPAVDFTELLLEEPTLPGVTIRMELRPVDPDFELWVISMYRERKARFLDGEPDSPNENLRKPWPLPPAADGGVPKVSADLIWTATVIEAMQKPANLGGEPFSFEQICHMSRSWPTAFKTLSRTSDAINDAAKKKGSIPTGSPESGSDWSASAAGASAAIPTSSSTPATPSPASTVDSVSSSPQPE